MDKVTSQLFFKYWLETVNSRKDHLSNIWRNATDFTSNVKGDEASIMSEIAYKLDLKCYYNDYYFLDTVLYKDDDLVPRRPKDSYWFRDIRVAFEHENSFRSGLYQEVSHLLITNCDLRVLVTYPNTDIEADEGLKYLHKVVKGSRKSTQISNEESFLIIFGWENGFQWDGYIYKEDGWMLMD